MDGANSLVKTAVPEQLMCDASFQISFGYVHLVDACEALFSLTT